MIKMFLILTQNRRNRDKIDIYIRNSIYTLERSKKRNFRMTKELQKDKKTPDPTNKILETFKNQVTDIEVKANIHMSPKNEYPIKIKIIKFEKARPNINPWEFELNIIQI